jgi:hypothetical protein
MQDGEWQSSETALELQNSKHFFFCFKRVCIGFLFLQLSVPTDDRSEDKYNKKTFWEN